MKVLIIEDEAAAARRLQKLLLEIDPGIEVLEQLDSIESCLIWLESSHPPVDLVLMDIHLADGSSFEIFKHTTIDAPIIFTTAYDEYAIQAFKVNAIDYILKPIKKADLETALEKFKRLQTRGHLNYQQLLEILQPAYQLSHTKRFLIKFAQTIKVVDLKDVVYFYTEDKITFLVTKEGKRYPIDYSLEKLEAMLNTRQFFRINRQFILSIKAIKEMHTYSKSRVRVNLDPPMDSHRIIISSERSSRFKKWLTGEI